MSAKDLVRSELTKALTTRLWWGLLIGVVLYTAGQAGLTAGFAGVDPGAGQPASPGLEETEAVRGVYAGSTFNGAYIFALILGITAMTGEYRYQTVTSTFLATPRRSRVVLAKYAAHLLLGAGYGVAAAVAAFTVGGMVVLTREGTLGLGAEGLWQAVALAVVAVGIWTLVGIGVGTLLRNQVAAILVGVAVAFLVEPLIGFALSALDLEAVARFLPTLASNAMTSPPDIFGNLLPWWGGALTLLGYAGVFGLLGVLVSVRRDIT